MAGNGRAAFGITGSARPGPPMGNRPMARRVRAGHSERSVYGAGKTTFVRTVATLVPPSGGELRVRGMAAASAVIEMLGLGEVAGRRAGTYSGGQRRRLDLGASLVGAPRLLLLDEPATGLDPAGRAEAWAAVRSLVAAGTDIVLTTHYLEEAGELAGQVVVIDHGKAIAAGGTAELKAGIGRDIIEVALADGSQLGAAAAVLETLTASQAVTDHTGRRVRSQASDGTAQLSAAIAALDNARIPVDEIALRHPTLDEVFLTLTDAKADSLR